jgi:hypothetical protein
MEALRFNLVLGWTWILLGFVSGMGMGMCFHKEGWLGGYGSFPRRLYRLGHISFFGLGIVNLIFYATAAHFARGGLMTVASWAFVSGAITMPVCCLLMAHFPKAHFLFAVPVLSLIAGGFIVVGLCLTPGRTKAPDAAGKEGHQETVSRAVVVPTIQYR